MTQEQRLSIFERYRRLVFGEPTLLGAGLKKLAAKPPPANDCPICGAVPVLPHTGFCSPCTKGIDPDGPR